VIEVEMAEDDAIDIRRRQAALFEQFRYRPALVVSGSIEHDAPPARSGNQIQAAPAEIPAVTRAKEAGKKYVNARHEASSKIGKCSGLIVATQTR
jgi:hypothetical protein